ncbi:DUF551 domain-containing protein [Escherichia coli]|nr:DUF551 domain-containing protein [Escherichia coli]
MARIALASLASLAAVSDERAAYELFMEKRFGESVDRRRAKNGDREYMAWDMALGWIIWCHRAAMLHCAEPASKHEELPLDYLQGQKDGLEWAAQLAEANHPQTGDWLYDDPLDLAKAIRKGPDIPEFAGPHPVTPDGWISCSDRMPEDTKMLLAFSQGEIVAAYWNWVVNPIDYKKYRAFTYLSGYILDDVTHWMPLPEPPQEVNRG